MKNQNKTNNDMYFYFILTIIITIVILFIDSWLYNYKNGAVTLSIYVELIILIVASAILAVRSRKLKNTNQKIEKKKLAKDLRVTYQKASSQIDSFPYSDKQKEKTKLAVKNKLFKEEKASRLNTDDLLIDVVVKRKSFGDIFSGIQLFFVYAILLKGITAILTKTPFYDASISYMVAVFFGVAAFILMPILMYQKRIRLIKTDLGRDRSQFIVIVIALIFMMFDQTIRSVETQNAVINNLVNGYWPIGGTALSIFLFAAIILLIESVKRVLKF